MTTKTKALPEKFDDLSAGMRLRLIERDDEIEIFILALLARTHAFFLGEPGIAKSLLVEHGIDLINGLTSDDYFHILFMKSTTREDVFGPLALSKLKEDRYLYRSEGFLPSAKLVFGDEFWKANGAIQNALLWATNERLYRNDGKVTTIPLHSMFIASNEMPEDDSLLAIYDRFPLRRVVKAIAEPGGMTSMLQIAAAPKTKVAPVISWAEIEQAAGEVQNVKIPNDVIETLVEVREKLREISIYPSDRRFAQALQIVKAKAWWDGETEADIEHLRPLEHVLWTDPETYPAVKEMMWGLANPIDLEIMKISEDLSKLNREIDSILKDTVDEEIRQRTGTQIFDKVESAKDELVGISARLKGSKRRSKKLGPALDQVTHLTRRVLVDVFRTNQPVDKGLEQFVEPIDAEDEDE